MKNHALILIFLIMLQSCQEDLCEDVAYNPLRIGFYITENFEDQSVIVENISVKGLNQSEFIYDNEQAGMIELPLDVSRDECGFELVFYNEIRDTIKIEYSRNLTIISVECGFATFFEITDIYITNNLIESYSIKEYNITDTNEEHISFYLLNDAAD